MSKIKRATQIMLPLELADTERAMLDVTTSSSREQSCQNVIAVEVPPPNALECECPRTTGPTADQP